jgi:hypothetical protein
MRTCATICAARERNRSIGFMPPRLKHPPLQPFGQVLAGVAHSSGTLVQGSNPGAANAGAAFAGIFDGGLGLRATPRFSIRLIEADYLLTTFDKLTDADRFAVLMNQVAGKRLTYAELTGKGTDSVCHPEAAAGQEEPF